MAGKDKPKRPKQQDLIENREIKRLTDLAHEYAEIRDQRQAALREEIKLKEKLLAELKKQELTTYIYQDVEVDIVPEGETVRVKIRKPKKEKEPKD